MLGAAKTATKSPLINALPDLHMHTTSQDHCPACYGPLYYEELAQPQYEAPSATTPTPAPAAEEEEEEGTEPPDAFEM